MYRSVLFSKNVNFLGRNGMFGAKAVTLVVHGTLSDVKVVSIAPITTKGIEGRCWIEIPANNIPNMIDALKSLAEEIKKEEQSCQEK